MKSKLHMALIVINLITVPTLLSVSFICLFVAVYTDNSALGIAMIKASMALACIHLVALLGHGIANIIRSISRRGGNNGGQEKEEKQ